MQRSLTESQNMTKHRNNIGAAPTRKAVRVPQCSVLWAPQSKAKLCSTHSTKHRSVQQVACSRLHAEQSMLLPIAHAPQVIQPSNNSSFSDISLCNPNLAHFGYALIPAHQQLVPLLPTSPFNYPMEGIARAPRSQDLILFCFFPP